MVGLPNRFWTELPTGPKLRYLLGEHAEYYEPSTALRLSTQSMHLTKLSTPHSLTVWPDVQSVEAAPTIPCGHSAMSSIGDQRYTSGHSNAQMSSVWRSRTLFQLQLGDLD